MLGNCYRWTSWFGISRNIEGMWYDLYYGIGNIFRWLPIIWSDRDWDSAFLMRMMEKKLSFTIPKTYHWHVMGADRSRRQMMICRELLRRLDRDEYYDSFYKTFGRCRYAAVLSLKQEKADLELLGKMIGKYLTHWWD